jgi:hypothetical protein
MQFIKKHYEKIILSIVLLGLVGVLAFMPVMIYTDQQRMRDLRLAVIPQKVNPLPPLDMSRQDAVLKQLESSYVLDLSTTNKLFNPVTWRRMSDGRMVKAMNLGPNAAVVTKITPLYFIISLDSVITNELSVRYKFSIQDQAATQQWQRRARPRYASKGEKVEDKTVDGKDEGFTLVDVKGPPDNPTELDLKLTDTQETFPLTKDKPFRRLEAYSADLKYDPEKYNSTGLRVGDRLTFAGGAYNVIAIDKNSVTLLAQSNQKKYILPYTP